MCKIYMFLFPSTYSKRNQNNDIKMIILMWRDDEYLFFLHYFMYLPIFIIGIYSFHYFKRIIIIIR